MFEPLFFSIYLCAFARWRFSLCLINPPYFGTQVSHLRIHEKQTVAASLQGGWKEEGVSRNTEESRQCRGEIAKQGD